MSAVVGFAARAKVIHGRKQPPAQPDDPIVDAVRWLRANNRGGAYKVLGQLVLDMIEEFDKLNDDDDRRRFGLRTYELPDLGKLWRRFDEIIRDEKERGR